MKFNKVVSNRPVSDELKLTPRIVGADPAGVENGYLAYRVWIDRLPTWMQNYYNYIVPYAVVTFPSGTVPREAEVDNYELLDGFVDVHFSITTSPRAISEGTVQIGYQERVNNVLKNKSPLSNPFRVFYVNPAKPFVVLSKQPGSGVRKGNIMTQIMEDMRR